MAREKSFKIILFRSTLCPRYFGILFLHIGSLFILLFFHIDNVFLLYNIVFIIYRCFVWMNLRRCHSATMVCFGNPVGNGLAG
jgi:hypothetical protein